MAGRRLWRKRLWRSVVEGYRQGYARRSARPVEAKEVTRPVMPVQEGGLVEHVDGGLRSGKIATEEWRLDDGVQGQDR